MTAAQVHPPPPPRGSPPRYIGNSNPTSLLKFAGIWTAASLFATVLMLLIGEPFWADWILDARGVTTEGEVLSAKVLPHDPNSGGSSIVAMRVRFHDRRGRAFILEKSVVAGAQTKVVEYDPHDPSVNRLKGGSASLIGYWAFFPMSFLLMGLFLLALALYVSYFARGGASVDPTATPAAK